MERKSAGISQREKIKKPAFLMIKITRKSRLSQMDELNNGSSKGLDLGFCGFS